jgi:hypothetical protein
MTGEISLGGVYVPALLVFGAAGLALTGVLTQVFLRLGLYKFFAYRPVVDLCIFLLIVGAFVLMTEVAP